MRWKLSMPSEVPSRRYYNGKNITQLGLTLVRFDIMQ